MLTIYVCIGSACHLKGSYDVINALQKQIEKYNLTKKISINAAFCLGHCTKAVSVKINDEFFSVNPSTVDSFFENEILRRVS